MATSPVYRRAGMNRHWQRQSAPYPGGGAHHHSPWTHKVWHTARPLPTTGGHGDHKVRADGHGELGTACCCGNIKCSLQTSHGNATQRANTHGETGCSQQQHAQQPEVEKTHMPVSDVYRDVTHTTEYYSTTKALNYGRAEPFRSTSYAVNAL